MHKLDEIMKAFGEKIGVADLSPDEDGVYHLELDERPVSIMEIVECDQAVVWTNIGDLPSEGLEAFYRQVMAAMSPAGDADGSVLSIKPESNVLCLHRVEDLRTLDLVSFVADLEKFADMLDRWTVRLADFRPQTESVGVEAGFLRI